MDKSSYYFIRILSDHLMGNKSDSFPDIQWEQIVQLAQNHKMEGIVYYQCREFLPQQINIKLQTAFSATIFYYANRNNTFNSIKKAAEEQGIILTSVKGFNIAKYYPQPILRTMGDLDILVHKEDKKRIDRILIEMGMITKKRDPESDWLYQYNGLCYELHHKLFYDEIATPPKQIVFFNHFWIFVHNGELDWTFHFLFLIAHLRKHFITQGVGIRQFMDLAVIVKNGPELDWKWLEEKLLQLDMHHFAQVCFGLLDYWFAIKTPITYPTLDRMFVEEATERILKNGVFGFQDDSNKTNALTNRVRRFGGSRWQNRCRMFIEALFPKYEKMRYVSYYSFLNERPWLLPIGWIYRIYRMLTGRTVHWYLILKKILIANDVFDKRFKELDKWGL